MGNATIKDYIEQVIENRDPEIMREFYEEIFSLHNEGKVIHCDYAMSSEFISITKQADTLMREDKRRYGQ